MKTLRERVSIGSLQWHEFLTKPLYYLYVLQLLLRSNSPLYKMRNCASPTSLLGIAQLIVHVHTTGSDGQFNSLSFLGSQEQMGKYEAIEGRRYMGATRDFCITCSHTVLIHETKGSG